MTYLWFKALHLVGVVAWMAGLFYLVRLFVYHAEAAAKPEPARTILIEQYRLMERRLLRGITTPAMLITVAAATVLYVLNPTLLRQPWMHVKLLFVTLLLAYHHLCGRTVKKLASATPTQSGEWYRWANEVPTVILLAVAVLVVFKGAVSWMALAVALVTLLVLIVVGIRVYARVRARTG